jgi:group II intron reverse transcriptase/maturase
MAELDRSTLARARSCLSPRQRARAPHVRQRDGPSGLETAFPIKGETGELRSPIPNPSWGGVQLSWGIPCVRDRVVEGAIRQVLEPIFELEFAEHSYGFRPGRSAQQAVARVEKLLKEGYTWIVDADLKSYFDSIPQNLLLQRIAQRVSDRKVLQLIAQSLKAGILEEMKDWQPTEVGTPQGSVLSPLLANIYLNPMDHLVAGAGLQMTR